MSLENHPMVDALVSGRTDQSGDPRASHERSERDQSRLRISVTPSPIERMTASTRPSAAT